MMKDKKKKLGNTAAALVVAASAYTVGVNQESISDTVSGAKEYVVVNDSPYSVMALKEDGVSVKERLPLTKGYVIKASPEKAQNLKDRGLQVYENKTYTIKAAMYRRPGRGRPGWGRPDRPGRPDQGEAPVCEPCDRPEPVDPTQPVAPTEPTPIAPTPPVTGDEVPWGIARVNAPEARAKVNSKNVLVAVIDTGCDASHPDLQGLIVGGRGFTQSGTWADNQGHGTHVTGTISSLIDGKGIAGVSQASILCAKALDSNGSGTSSAIAEAIRYSADSGASVINLSLGSPYSSGPDALIKQAVEYASNKGVILAMAAGNDSGRTGWPAGIECANCYAVAASDSNNRISSFSSRGPEIDVIAPGSAIKSTQMGGGYVTWDGTSMATPHVAGVFALAIAAGKKVIKTSDIGLPAEHQGKGLVDALKSVSE